MRKRELIGVVFLIIGASGVFLSIRQSPPQFLYLTATRDIWPGEIVSSADFESQSLYLSDSGGKYVSGDVKLNGHKSVRMIARGEVIPRAAFTSQAKEENRRLLTFVVPKIQMPKSLKPGDLIDIYFFSIPDLQSSGEPSELDTVIEKIRVKSIDHDDAQLGGKVTISALFEEEKAREIMTLIARSTIAIAQRFDLSE